MNEDSLALDSAVRGATRANLSGAIDFLYEAVRCQKEEPHKNEDRLRILYHIIRKLEAMHDELNK